MESLQHAYDESRAEWFKQPDEFRNSNNSSYVELKEILSGIVKEFTPQNLVNHPTLSSNM